MDFLKKVFDAIGLQYQILNMDKPLLWVDHWFLVGMHQNILTTGFSVSHKKLHFSVSNQKLHISYQILHKGWAEQASKNAKAYKEARMEKKEFHTAHTPLISISLHSL